VTTRTALTRTWQRLGIPADYARTRKLALQREAKRLVRIGRNPDGRILRLTPAAARAWRQMRAAAAADGLELIQISAFRSVQRQTTLIRRKLAAGKSIGEILRYMAAPGFSEHHTGRALDIGSPGHTELEEKFAQTAAFRWLRKHAGTFGFRLSYPRHNRHGIGYEPWHWCWHR
jgi:D-alanyl-D-alanine carboxypeptidase